MSPTADLSSQSQPVLHPAQVLYISLELSPIQVAGHLPPVRNRQDVKASRPWRRRDRAARVLAELKTRAERRAGARDYRRDPRGGDGRLLVHRLLEANGVESWWLIPPPSRCPGGSTRQERRDRRRDVAAHAPRLPTRRASCLLDGPSAERRGGGSPADHARARTLLRERIEHTNRIKGLLIELRGHGLRPAG